MTTHAHLKDLAKTRLIMLIDSSRRAMEAIDHRRYEDVSLELKSVSASLNTAAGCLGRLMVSEPKRK